MIDIYMPRNLTLAQRNVIEELEFGAKIIETETDDSVEYHLEDESGTRKKINYKTFERLFEAELISLFSVNENEKIYL